MRQVKNFGGSKSRSRSLCVFLRLKEAAWLCNSWCTGPGFGQFYPQYWLNTLVEWPAISGRLLMWLTALNSVEGLLFWVDDVWAAQAGGVK